MASHLTTVERQRKIVEILSLLHEGGKFEEAKKMFDESFDGVDVTEITSAERELIQNGLNPMEIQKLCNVHAAVFKGSITDIHRSNYEHEQPGHPVSTLKLENRVIRSLMDDEIREVEGEMEKGDWSGKERLIHDLTDLLQIQKHYHRKETLIFSYMEKYGITAPPKVMWGVDDKIIGQIKDVLAYAKEERAVFNILQDKLESTLTEIEEMIFKEEEIMIPMCLDVFSLRDWEKIEEDSADIGYAFIPEPLKWKASEASLEAEKENEPIRLANIERSKMTTEAIKEGLEDDLNNLVSEKEDYEWEHQENTAEQVVLPTGILQLDQLVAIFENLPVDLTFVDNNDTVRFYSESGDRVFPRTKSVIGRKVINCHPPKSMYLVDQILKDFRAKKRDKADFWLEVHEKMIYIRYFALYGTDGEYMGCLEVTQNVTGIRALEGEKRLLDEA